MSDFRHFSSLIVDRGNLFGRRHGSGNYRHWKSIHDVVVHVSFSIPRQLQLRKKRQRAPGIEKKRPDALVMLPFAGSKARANVPSQACSTHKDRSSKRMMAYTCPTIYVSTISRRALAYFSNANSILFPSGIVSPAKTARVKTNNSETSQGA